MRLLALLVAVSACAPVVATIDPLNDEVVEVPLPEGEETSWDGVWIPTALDRLMLRGNREDGCLRIGLVAPGGWPNEYEVDVAEPWALESALWGDEPCPSDPYGAWTGLPLPLDGLDGSIAVTPEWPPSQVDLELQVQVGDTAWTEDAVFELSP